MNIQEIRHFIYELKGIDASHEYITREGSRFTRTNSKSAKALNTDEIIAIAQSCLKSLNTLELPAKEKAKICSELDISMTCYQNRVSSGKTVMNKLYTCLCRPVDTLADCRAKIKTEGEKYAAVPHFDTPIITNQDELFTKKFDRSISFDPSDPDLGIAVVHTAIKELRKDPLMDQLLNTWHQQEKGKYQQEELSLVSLMTHELGSGTCWGQAMSILELLQSQEKEKISEEYIAKNIQLLDAVRYQIVETLRAYVANQKSAFIFGIPSKEVLDHVNSYFPYHDKRGKSSEKLHLCSYQTELLWQRISDFIKTDIRGDEGTNQTRDYAILIELDKKNSLTGHGAIIHYSESQKCYFWYDPYSKAHGLFSSTNHKEFLRGVAEKLLEYKDKNVFERVVLTAYRI